MSLILKPPSWAKCTANFGTGTPGTTLGTTITAGASANADGSTSSCIAALAHDCEYLVIGFTNVFTSAGNGAALCDILIDPAGGTSWNTAPLINDLMAGHTGTINISGNPAGAVARWYHFPLWIKSGTSIGARLRSATASQAGQIVVLAYGGNAHPGSWWCGQAVTEIGATPASSTGTAHTPGNSGAFSTWTNLGSTLPAPTGALQFAAGGGALSSMTALQYFWEFGVSSIRLGPPFYMVGTANEATGLTPPGPLFCSLPSGTQLQVRGTCSGTAQALDVMAYAVH